MNCDDLFCPCGGTPTPNTSDDDWRIWHSIECDECHEETDWQFTPELAASQWVRDSEARAAALEEHDETQDTDQTLGLTR